MRSVRAGAAGLVIVCAGAAAADLRPARTIEGSPVYVLTEYPTVAELAGLAPKTPAPIFVVRSDWPRAAELTRFVHFGAPAVLVVAASRYPEPNEAAILVHASSSLRIIFACDRLPSADEVRSLRHASRRIEILLPATLGGGLDDLLKGVRNAGAFTGSAALRLGLLRAAGIRPRAPLGRPNS